MIDSGKFDNRCVVISTSLNSLCRYKAYFFDSNIMYTIFSFHSRQILFNHRAALADQLDRESEPAMALHLASVILFQYHTNTLLHAPGKFVPQIIMFLQTNISEEDFVLLTEYHALVVQQLKNAANSKKEDTTSEAPASSNVDVMLNDKLPGIKNIVKNMKKSSSAAPSVVDA